MTPDELMRMAHLKDDVERLERELADAREDLARAHSREDEKDEMVRVLEAAFKVELARLRAALARANERNDLVEQRAGELITEARGRIAALEAAIRRAIPEIHTHDVAVAEWLIDALDGQDSSATNQLAQKFKDNLYRAMMEEADGE